MYSIVEMQGQGGGYLATVFANTMRAGNILDFPNIECTSLVVETTARITNNVLTSYDTTIAQVVAGNASVDIDLSGLNLPAGCYLVFFGIYTNATPPAYLNSVTAVMNKGAASDVLVLSAYYPGIAQVTGKNGAPNTLTFQNLYTQSVGVFINNVFIGSTPTLTAIRQ